MKTTMPPSVQRWVAMNRAPLVVIAKPISVSASGVRPSRPRARAIGSKTPLTRSRAWSEIVNSRSQDLALRAATSPKASGRSVPNRLAAHASRRYEPSDPESLEMVAHEWLR